MTTDDNATLTPADRPYWMGVLARAPAAALETAWAGVAPDPAWHLLRAPECGLVMVQGRAGGNGQPFNLGEMTATRCSVQLADGTVGHGYVAGRDRRKAELAALFDALLQGPAGPGLMASLIAPLAAQAAAARTETSRAAAATRVDFLGLVRSR